MTALSAWLSGAGVTPALAAVARPKVKAVARKIVFIMCVSPCIPVNSGTVWRYHSTREKQSVRIRSGLGRCVTKIVSRRRRLT
jgi:hypothetical protein